MKVKKIFQGTVIRTDAWPGGTVFLEHKCMNKYLINKMRVLNVCICVN